MQHGNAVWTLSIDMQYGMLVPGMIWCASGCVPMHVCPGTPPLSCIAQVRPTVYLHYPEAIISLEAEKSDPLYTEGLVQNTLLTFASTSTNSTWTCGLDKDMQY
jgi:hypothetical protein